MYENRVWPRIRERRVRDRLIIAVVVVYGVHSFIRAPGNFPIGRRRAFTCSFRRNSEKVRKETPEEYYFLSVALRDALPIFASRVFFLLRRFRSSRPRRLSRARALYLACFPYNVGSF